MPLVNSTQLNKYTPRKQILIKNSNKESIILALSEPKRFSELEKTLKMSQTTLTKHLNELESENKIEKIIQNGKPVYQLTKKGESYLMDAINLSNDVDRIRSRGGKHYRYRSSFGDILQKPKSSLGVESDLTLDKELDKLHLLHIDDINDIKELVLKKIVKNMKKQKLTQKQTGQLVLGFVMDYPTLLGTLHLTPKKLAKSMAKLVHKKTLENKK